MSKKQEKKAAKKAAPKAAKPKKVKVVAQRRLVEAGELHLKGETFEVTAKRAESLGPLVKPAD